jgi:hypothetical protein
MVASALAANGNLHVFVAKDDNLKYTWQKKGENYWHGGEPGKSTASLSQFALAPDEIVGVSASLSNADVLHVFVKCKNGNTYYTFQRPNETSWNGGQSGKTIAGLVLFAK